MKQTFKQQLGKNEQVYDLLTIEDGTMTLEVHVEERVLTYPCTTMTDQYGQEWVCYGKGSRIRLYDGKGNMDKRWVVTDLVTDPVTVVTNPVTEEKLNDERYSEYETEQKIENSFNQTINQENKKTNKQENNIAINQSGKQTINQTINKAIKQTINKAKNSASLQFTGGVAAFLVGMVVMYNIGLLLPLGAAGLLVAGVVK